MDDDLTLPDFLDRKLNGIAPATPEEIRMAKAVRREPRIVWPKKRNWKKIEERRRRQEKVGLITVRRGQ
jgi:hypothetical protein